MAPKRGKAKGRAKGKGKAKGKQPAAVPPVPALPMVPDFNPTDDSELPLSVDPQMLVLDRTTTSLIADNAGSSAKSGFLVFGEDESGDGEDDGGDENDENVPMADFSVGEDPVRVQDVGKAHRPLITAGNKVDQWVATLGMVSETGALSTIDMNANAPVSASGMGTDKWKPMPVPSHSPLPSTEPPPQTMDKALALARQTVASINTAVTGGGGERKYPVSHKRFCEAVLAQEHMDISEMPAVKTIAGRGDLYIALSNGGKVDEVLRVSSQRLSELSDYFREPIDVLHRERSLAAHTHLRRNENAPMLTELLTAMYLKRTTNNSSGSGSGSDIVVPSDEGLGRLQWFFGQTICLHFLCPAEIEIEKKPSAQTPSSELPEGIDPVKLFQQYMESPDSVPEHLKAPLLWAIHEIFEEYQRTSAAAEMRRAFLCNNAPGEHMGFPAPLLPEAQPTADTYTPVNAYNAELPHNGALHVHCEECQWLPNMQVSEVPRLGLFPLHVAKYHYTYTTRRALRQPMFASETADGSSSSGEGSMEGANELHDDGGFGKYPVPITGMIHLELGGNGQAALRMKQLRMLLHAVHGHPDGVPDALSTDEFWHLLGLAERLGIKKAIAPFVNAWRATFAAHNPEPTIRAIVPAAASATTTGGSYHIDSAVVNKLRVGYAIGCAKTVQDAMRYVAWHLTLGKDLSGRPEQVTLRLPPSVDLETRKN